jgi:hypothetical protein
MADAELVLADRIAKELRRLCMVATTLEGQALALRRTRFHSFDPAQPKATDDTCGAPGDKLNGVLMGVDS